MTDDYAPQFQTPCVLLDENDHDADAVIAFASRIGAYFNDEPGSRCLVLQFPGRPQAMRRSKQFAVQQRTENK